MPEQSSNADGHAALFAAYGAEPGDWRALALALARRHEPGLCCGETRRGPGAPVKWDDLARACAAQAVKEVQAASAAGRIRRNLSTLTAACTYLTEDTLEAREWRERAYIPEGTSMENLRNRVSEVRSLAQRAVS